MGYMHEKSWFSAALGAILADSRRSLLHKFNVIDPFGVRFRTYLVSAGAQDPPVNDRFDNRK